MAQIKDLILLFLFRSKTFLNMDLNETGQSGLEDSILRPAHLQRLRTHQAEAAVENGP